MLIIFLSNTFNHHQMAISNEFYRLTDGNYFFIETQPMSDERKNMGWSLEEQPDYVLHVYKNDIERTKCLNLINSADVVITGMASEKYLIERKKQKKLIFRYSERLFKRKNMYWQIPLRIIKYNFQNRKNNNIYMLCSSAYAAFDYNLSLSFKNKTYKWGYFPKTVRYSNIEKLINEKTVNSILWTGRFIDWKHPEIHIKLAKFLKDSGINFKLTMIGNGIMFDSVKKMINDFELNEYVSLLGVKTPDEVRTIMEQSQIFIFTSDYAEGWGAVLNEAMNSACAVVASHAIGAVPFLIENGNNGMIYENKNEEDLFEKVKLLLNNSQKRIEISKNAFNTIIEEWNGEIAAQNFIKLINTINRNDINLIDSGPCSKAKIIKNNWFVE